MNEISELSPRHYRLMAWFALGLTLVVLMMPGMAMEGLRSWIWQWWPWPSPDMQPDSLPVDMDKLVHGLLFAVSGALLVRGWLGQTRTWWPLYLMLIVYGVLTELAQEFIPGRAPSAMDVLADGVGAALGIAWALMFRPRPAPRSRSS